MRPSWGEVLAEFLFLAVMLVASVAATTVVVVVVLRMMGVAV